jgi:hypothetical protein
MPAMPFSGLVGNRWSLGLFIVVLLSSPTKASAGALDKVRGAFTGPGGSPEIPCADPVAEVLKTAADAAGAGGGGGIPVTGNSMFRHLVTPLKYDPKTTPSFAVHRDEVINQVTLGLQQSANLPPLRSHKIVVLTGDDGVGRSSIMQEIGLRASKNSADAWPGASANSRKFWQGREVVALNLTLDNPAAVLKDLVGYINGEGIKVPGIIEKAKKNNQVLFIDDISILIKPENSNTVHLELEKIRKLLLSGDVPIVVEATPKGFGNLENQLGDLARRLHRVDVPELQGEELLDAVAASAKTAETHFDVTYSADCYSAALEAGKRFDFGKTTVANPGAAIELLQRATIYLRHSSNSQGKMTVDAASFATALDAISKGGYKQIDKKLLQNLDKEVLSAVKGQDEPVHDILKGIRTGIRRNLKGGSWRVKGQLGVGGSFALMGPSGVGKSFTPKTIREKLGLSEKNLIMFEKLDFFGEHGLAIFKGAPKGYKGMGTGGDFVNRVREAKGPIIVIFDEFEKYPLEIRNAVLTMLEEGKVTDFDGNVAYLRDAYFFFPMNTGEKQILQMVELGTPRDQISAMVERIAVQELGAPFVGRTRTIVFNPMDRQALEGIFNNVWKALQKVANDFGIDQPIELTNFAKDEIIELTDIAMGGRNLVGNVIEVLSEELSDLHLLARPDAKLLAEQKMLIGGLDEKVDDLVKITVTFKDGHFMYHAQLKDGTVIYRTLRSRRLIKPEAPAGAAEAAGVPQAAAEVPEAAGGVTEVSPNLVQTRTYNQPPPNSP